jgi:CHAT domain-containing protein/tetratricopeptide (TPR) repeat protein
MTEHIKLYNLFTNCAREEIGQQELKGTLSKWLTAGTLNAASVMELDRLLEQIDEKAPRFALSYRRMNLMAAKMVGDPGAQGNTAFSACRVAVNIEGDFLLGAEFQAEAVEAYAQLLNFSGISANFRNLEGLFAAKASEDIGRSVAVVDRLLTCLLGMIRANWNQELLGACVKPALSCLTSLAEQSEDRSDFHTLLGKALQQVIPALPSQVRAGATFHLAYVRHTYPHPDKDWPTAEQLMQDASTNSVFVVQAHLARANWLFYDEAIEVTRRTLAAWQLFDEAAMLVCHSDDPKMAAADVGEAKLLAALQLGQNIDSIGPIIDDAIAAGEAAITYNRAIGDDEKRLTLLMQSCWLRKLGHDMQGVRAQTIEALEIFESDQTAYLGALPNLIELILILHRETDDALILARGRNLLETALSSLPADSDDPGDRLQRWQLSKQQIVLADEQGDAEAGLQAALEAAEAIKGLSLTDEADAIFYVGVQRLNQGQHAEAMEEFERAADIAERVWHDESKQAGPTAAQQVRSQLYTHAAYFRRFYGVPCTAEQIKGHAKSALTWLERGASALNVHILRSREGRERVSGAKEVERLMERLVERHPECLFLRFHMHSDPPACFAWSQREGVKAIWLPSSPSELRNKVLNLATTELESDRSFWSHYDRWIRTRSGIHRSRWLAALELLANRIGELLIAPVLSQMITDGIQRIVIVPDAWLAALPFQIAQLPSGVHLNDAFELVQVPDMLTLGELPRSGGTRPGKFAVVSGGHADLPWAGYEVDEVYRILASCQNLAGGSLMRTIPDIPGLAQALSDTDLRTVHLASHMSYSRGKASASAIQIVLESENGPTQTLSMQDLLAGDPLAIPVGATIVMSGCESNFVDLNLLDTGGEGISLASAVLLGGARTVVASSWGVDDRASFLFMRHFYDVWAGNGLVNVAEALQSTAKWLRERTADQVDELTREWVNPVAPPSEAKEFPFANPFYWGAWSCVGSWQADEMDFN